MFRYGYEAMIYSQYENNPVTFNGITYDILKDNYKFQVLHLLYRFLFGFNYS